MPDKTQSLTAYYRERAIKPKTPEMEALLGVGYGGMTVEKAKTIIKERKEDPQLWPYSEYEKAVAFLAAYEAQARVISTRPGDTQERVTD